ncbi:hypothetical protein BD413DRAFT_492141 [Trametes elegans]|nr:hypothetical protein BD413DRAFT_492141 [Trametes elegans]
MLSRRAVFLLLALLSAINVYLDVLYVRETRRLAETRARPPGHYSFDDENYPPRMALPSARRAVKLTIEDSARYALWAAEAEDEWLSTATVGDGNVHLGPYSRLFVPGITHQLHCMRYYRDALAQDDPVHAGHQVGHLAHCLNFLRMSTLCAADTTLEPPDAFTREYRVDRAGGEHVCLDWPAFYEEMRANFLNWTAYQRDLGWER